MAWFICLVGIPGSGKSTYAKRPYFKDYNVFSSDALRKQWYGSEDIQGNPKEIFEELNRLVKKSLDDGQNCIFDATNINKEQRKGFISNLNIANNHVMECAFIDTSLEQCLDNNLKRSRIVPESVIIKMYNKLDVPTLDEGWDIVSHVNLFYGSDTVLGWED